MCLLFKFSLLLNEITFISSITWQNGCQMLYYCVSFGGVKKEIHIKKCGVIKVVVILIIVVTKVDYDACQWNYYQRLL